MLLPLSVLKALSSSQGFWLSGATRGNFGGAMTLVGYGFFIGEIGLRPEGKPTPTPTPTALRGSRPAGSPLQGFDPELQTALC